MAHGQMVIDTELNDENLLIKNIRNSSKNIQIAQFSDNEDIQKLNYYLFSNISDIDFYTIDNLDESQLSEVDNLDIIVFNKEDEKLKELLLHNIKAKDLNTKFFVISNKSYLRQKDMLQEHINGVDKFLKMDFFLEDYILSMEKFIRRNFYSKRALELEYASDVLLFEKKIFDEKIEELLQKRIFFSIFEFDFDTEIDITSYNLRKIVRECDLIYIDEKNSKITFLLQSVIPEFGAQIINKRIKNFSISLEEKKKFSAFDIIYEN